MSKKQTEQPTPEEIKKKAGFFWRMFSSFVKMLSKGLFRLIIPRKWDKKHITISLVVILGIVLLFVFFIKPVLDFLGIILLILAIIAILGGFYMFLTGNNPVKRD